MIILWSFTADVQVYFSPNDTCEKVILQALEEADNTIDVAMYFFTDLDIAYALTRAHSRGVAVRVLYDNEGAEYEYSKAKILVEEGIPVRMDSPDTRMHDKFAVIDDSVVLTGSYNWTSSAGTRNNENLLVISSGYLASLYEAEFLKLWDAGIDYLLPAETVYVTQAGEHYHREGCRYLKGDCTPLLKSEAEAQGYTPCSVCRP